MDYNAAHAEWQQHRQRQLLALWVYVTEIIKKEIVNPTLWRAMEVSRPLALEENMVIIGISGPQFNLASNMNQALIHTSIAKHMSTAANRTLDFRIIQGESFEDWMELKEREKTAAEMMAQKQKSQTPRPPTAERSGEAREAMAAGDNWEETITVLHRMFSSLLMKSNPQSRAQYVLEAMPVVYEAEKKLNAGDSVIYEDRGLGRALEKIAGFAETEPTNVALEYLRYKEAQSSAR